MAGTYTEEDKARLFACTHQFFTRRPLLQSTPAREDKAKPRVFNTSAQKKRAWQTNFERRRLGEPDGAREIHDPDWLKGHVH